MADLFNLADVGAADFAGAQRDASGRNTGDLRRKYNFGDRVSELAIASDPFFRFVSKLAKSPTDDPQFTIRIYYFTLFCSNSFSVFFFRSSCINFL